MSGATETPAGAKKPWKHGRAVADGVVQFTSVSALDKADNSSSTGCLRKWKYHYQFGIREGDNVNTERGNKGHAEIANYLTTGSRAGLSSVVLQGMHQIPPPGDDLLVEFDFVPDLPDGTSGLSQALLRAGGIPLVGAMDLVHARPENYGVQDIEETNDPPGVVKFVDWKFVGDIKNAKSGPDLVKTIQMSGYALWGFLKFPEMERARLAHGYFPMRGSPRVSTALVTREQVEKTWKLADSLGVLIKDAARESNIDLVEANVRACNAYGRDCPARKVCKAARDNDQASNGNSLAGLIGLTATERFFAPLPPSTPDSESNEMSQPPVSPNSLVARLQAQRAGTPVPAPAPAPVAPLLAPAPSGPSAAEIQAEMARLRAQEVAAAAPPVTLEQQIAKIEAFGLGFFAVSGEAARAVATLAGFTLEGEGLAGTGTLGAYSLSTVAEIMGVLPEVEAMAAAAASPAPAPAPELVGDAATDNTQAIAALTAAAETVPAAEPKKRTRRTKEQIAADNAKASAAPSDPAPEEQVSLPLTPASESNTVPSAPVEAPLSDYAAGTHITNNVFHGNTANASISITRNDASKPTTIDNATFVVEVPVSTAINLYVDCVVDGIPTTPLWPIVEKLMEKMTEHSGAIDFRTASQDSSYAFGRWKGIFAALLRESPAQGQLPPGNYAFDGSMGEIGSAVVESMRSVVRKSGGTFVKGVR